MSRTGATIRIFIILLTCSFYSGAFAVDITPTVSGSNPYCAGSSGTVTYTSSGVSFAVGNQFTVELSDPLGSFGTPTTIGSLSGTANSGSITVIFPAGASGTAYRVRIKSSNNAFTGAPNATALTISQQVTPTISIAATPSGTVGTGTAVYITSSTTNAGANPTFLWKRNGIITGGNTNAFVVPSATSNDNYTVTMTSSADCPAPASVGSNTINLSVDPNLTESDHAWEVRTPQLEVGNPIIRSNATGFTIGTKAYVGTGYVGTTSSPRKDFWEYDPATDVWTQKADLGNGTAAARYNAVGFNGGTGSIMGYIGLGVAGGVPMKDFWQYNQATNTWTARADLPGVAREQAFAFTIGNKGYVGGGYSNVSGDLQDFYEFDQVNTWTAKTNVPTKRRGVAAFSIGLKGFIAGGYNAGTSTYYKDFWDYDQSGNAWTQRPDVPGNGRALATGFALAGNGYVGLGYNPGGYNGEFYKYTVSTNSWSARPNFAGPPTSNYGVGLSIGNRAYIYKDGAMVEYSLLTTTPFASKICTGETIQVSFDASGFAFGVNNVFTAQMSPSQNFSVITTLGTISSTASTGTVPAVIPASANGTYYFRIVSNNPTLSTLLETIVVTSIPSVNPISSESGLSVCKDVSVTFKSQLTGTGFQWYKNNQPVGTDQNTYVDNALVNNDVITSTKTYTAGCSAPVLVSPLTPITMTVKTPAKPTISIVTNQPNTLSSSTANAYQWYQDNVPIANANKQTYAMLSSGTYKVRITDNSGCIAYSDGIQDAFTGLEPDPILGLVTAYPNPVVGEMVLEVSDELVLKGCDYTVLNELGQSVFGAQKASRLNKINFTGRSPGLYLVKLSVNGSTLIRRIVKVE